MKSNRCPGVTVTLFSDAGDLEEFGLQSSACGRQSYTYVESRPGQTFSVAFETNRCFPYKGNDLQVNIYLDGALGVSSFVRASEQYTIIEGQMSNDIHGRGTLCRFSFADLLKNDNSVNPQLKASYEYLGQIAVKVYRVKAVSRERARPTKSSAEQQVPATPRDDSVPEKVLKGRSQSIRAALGSAERTGVITNRIVEYPWGKHSFATFVFNYRTHKDLQDEDIIPRSPSPVPLEDRDPATLSRREALELIQTLRRRNEEATRAQIAIKREREDDNEERGPLQTSIEAGIPAAKRARVTLSNTAMAYSIPVIDLSAD